MRYSIFNPKVYFDTNVIGFYNIINFANIYSIKHLVFASSSSVYGDQAKYPIHEYFNTDKPLSFYAGTKKANEALGYSFSKIYKLPMTCMRLFTVYGPYGRPDMAPYKFTESAINKKVIKVYNKEIAERDFTFIDDVAHSIFKLSKKVPYNNLYQTFNICSGKKTKLSTFIKIIEKNLKVKIKKIYFETKGDVIKTYGSNKKLIKEIKFKKFTSIESGMKKFIEWF